MGAGTVHAPTTELGPTRRDVAERSDSQWVLSSATEVLRGTPQTASRESHALLAN